MSKVTPIKPLFIMLYGYPGAGKTHLARNLCETLGAAHLHSEKIRNELFSTPRHDQDENQLINHLMIYMAEEFLSAGMSVIFDAPVIRLSQRRELRNIVRSTKAIQVLIWLQIDIESAYVRLNQRDRRKTDDKYAQIYSRQEFDSHIQTMQNPKNEEYIVVSGKHTYNTQRSAVLKRLYEMGAVNIEGMNSNVVKPGLVNLIPQQLRGGRVDNTRRNILIR